MMVWVRSEPLGLGADRILPWSVRWQVRSLTQHGFCFHVFKKALRRCKRLFRSFSVLVCINEKSLLLFLELLHNKCILWQSCKIHLWTVSQHYYIQNTYPLKEHLFLSLEQLKLCNTLFPTSKCHSYQEK